MSRVRALPVRDPGLLLVCLMYFIIHIDRARISVAAPILGGDLESGCETLSGAGS
ncbi:MAG: hypothetical protein ACREPA_10615 [Candidatus Dormibacteraceae bacterium]